MSPADATGVRDELGQRATQLLGVLGVEVNFVAHAIETERHGLLGRTAVDVVKQLDLNGAGHTKSSGTYGFEHHPSDNTRIPLAAAATLLAKDHIRRSDRLDSIRLTSSSPTSSAKRA